MIWQAKSETTQPAVHLFLPEKVYNFNSLKTLTLQCKKCTTSTVWRLWHFNVCWVTFGVTILRTLTRTTWSLTPSLPQPVKFPGWKMHERACEQYIFRSCNTATFNAIGFVGCPSTWNAKKKTERLKGFTFYIFVGHFQATSWLKGLNVRMWSFCMRAHTGDLGL